MLVAMTKTLAPIVFDLDDVLAHFNHALCETLVDVTGDTSKFDDYLYWKQYEIRHLYPEIPRFDDVFHVMERTGVIARLKPVQPVVRIANMLADMGHPITVLTARGWMDDGHGVSSAWLEMAGVNVSNVIVSAHQKSKKDYMPEGVALYFDDNADHIIDCAPLVGRAILIAKPWNEAAIPHLPANARRVEVGDLYSHLGDFLDA